MSDQNNNQPPPNRQLPEEERLRLAREFRFRLLIARERELRAEQLRACEVFLRNQRNYELAVLTYLNDLLCDLNNSH